MEISSISTSALNGMNAERQKVELATLKLSLANATFSSRAELEGFVAQVNANNPALTRDLLSESHIRELKEPENPLANEEGLIYRLKVDPTAEMAGLVSSTRAYEANIRAYNTNVELIRAALKLGGGR